MDNYTRLYIDGCWIKPAQGDVFQSIDPSSETVIADVAAATAEDVDLAVRAARRTFDAGTWSGLSGYERAVYLRKIAAGIRERAAHLAALEVRDNGKPLPAAAWDVEDTAGTFDLYAELAEELDQSSSTAIALPDDRFSSVAVKEPAGVAAAIIPWNFPILMASWKVAPALAAGCTIVLKPSEVTSLTAIELADIIDRAGVPAGVFNLVTGLGKDAGAPLSEHPLVDKIAFTGSVPTGSRIMQAAARDLKNVSLELGGKSPFIIFDDANIEEAVEWILFGIFWNKGEVCSATSRVLIQDGIYDALMARLLEETARITIGNGMQDGILMGPLVNASQFDKVSSMIAAGVQEGATLVCGGKRPAGLDKGFYLEPTIFTDVPEDSTVWTEEIFGPVVCIRRFASESDAVQIANNSRFGLAGAVMSKDIDRCNRVARQLRAGIVWINCSQPTFSHAPWGGYKQSGIGRELGVWGLNNYLETKQITTFSSDKPWGWYIK